MTFSLNYIHCCGPLLVFGHEQMSILLDLAGDVEAECIIGIHHTFQVVREVLLFLDQSPQCVLVEGSC